MNSILITLCFIILILYLPVLTFFLKDIVLKGWQDIQIYSGKAVSARKTSYRIEIESKMCKEDFLRRNLKFVIEMKFEHVEFNDFNVKSIFDVKCRKSTSITLLCHCSFHNLMGLKLSSNTFHFTFGFPLGMSQWKTQTIGNVTFFRENFCNT